MGKAFKTRDSGCLETYVGPQEKTRDIKTKELFRKGGNFDELREDVQDERVFCTWTSTNSTTPPEAPRL